MFRRLLYLKLVSLLSISLTTGVIQAQTSKGLPGQRVFTTAHSFHAFVPRILAELAKSADKKDHKQVGISALGGSQVIRHWNLPDERNKAKQALRTGEVDVLTMSPIFLPDAGIENFTALALKHNPKVHIALQEFWLPFDTYDPKLKKRPKKVDHNALNAEQLRKLHAPYFESMDKHVKALNTKFGKQVIYVVPVGQAVNALREKIIAGMAPTLKEQEDLFKDAIGHPHPPLRVLVSYCHFAVIYRQSPVGLPLPRILDQRKNRDQLMKLNRLLQQLAWEAVIAHPLSGVRK